MNRRRWLGIVLLGMGLVAAPVPGRADTAPTNGAARQRASQSHDLEPLGAPGIDPELVLQLHLDAKRNQTAAELLKKYNIKPQDLQNLPQLLKQFHVDPKDPRLPPSLRQMLERIKPEDLAKQFSREQLEDIGKRLQGLEAGRTPQAAVPLQGSHPHDEEPQNRQEVPPTGMPRSPAGGGPSATSPEERGAAAQNAEDEEQSPIRRQLLQWADRLNRLDPSLRDSAAFRNAVRDLSRHVGEEDPRWEKLASGMNRLEGNWAAVKEGLHLDRLWPEKGQGWPGGLSRALPQLGLGGEARNLGNQLAGTLPSADTRAASDFFSWQTLLGLAGLIVLGAVLWRMLLGLERSRSRSQEGWQLGPWPVNPAAVSTREELVRGFEYLSLLCLGPAARTWNHRLIADQLADERRSLPQTAYFDDRRRAAAELAHLYEQARYAPPQDALPEPAFAAARRDLCLLAGVPTA